MRASPLSGLRTRISASISRVSANDASTMNNIRCVTMPLSRTRVTQAVGVCVGPVFVSRSKKRQTSPFSRQTMHHWIQPSSLLANNWGYFFLSLSHLNQLKKIASLNNMLRDISEEHNKKWGGGGVVGCQSQILEKTNGSDIGDWIKRTISCHQKIYPPTPPTLPHHLPPKRW